MEEKSPQTSEHKKRILLVEDDSLIALMESELLKAGGYEVITALSGEKALEIFHSGKQIDLILMDIDLGQGLDGAETASRILAKKDIPVVFISSHTEPEILNKTEAIASYGYIVKGSSDTAFFVSLNMAFRLHAAHQELLKKKQELEDLADSLSATVKKLLKMREELLVREQKLKETTEHLEATLNSLPDLLFELDEETTYLDIRAPNPELLYLPKEKLLGKKMTKILPNNISTAFIYALREAAEKGVSDFNYSLELPSGIHYFEATIARKGENRPGKNIFIALVRDITDRIEAELSQQKTEIRFYRLFQAMSEGVAIYRLLYDEHGQPVDYEIIEVNQAYVRHTGIEKEKAIGKKASELYGTGEPPYLDIYSQTVLTGKPASFEAYFLPLQRHFRITAFSLSEDMLATVFEDITERKQAELTLKEREERYRLIFQNIPLGILQFDQNGVITDCNDEFVRIIGSSREALIGFHLLERASEEKVKEAVRQALSGKIGYYEGIYHSVTAKKSTPTHGFFAGIFDCEGRFVSGIGIFEDFTDRLRMEKELKRALEEKQSVRRELQHRVKNTLALIHSLLNLELNRIKDKNARAPLESFRNRIMSLSRLYDLLAVSERYEEISLDRFVREISEFVVKSYASPAKKIDLDLDLEPVSLEVKPAISIGLVANEIITNSLKYAFSSRKSGRIEVRLKNQDNQLVLEISDNGMGLPNDITASATQGLGQEIIEALVDQLEAKLEVETRPENGTKFRLLIPVKPPLNND